MRMLAYPVLLAVLAAPLAGHAQVYKRVDKYGNVTFSDQPGPGAERVHVAPVQTYSAPKPKAAPAAQSGDGAAAGAGEAKAEPPDYEVAIVSPEHDAALRQNDGNVPISVRITPALQDKHQLQLVLDGAPVGDPGTGTSFVLPTVDRGTHVVAVEVVDASGNVLKRSKSVVFHLLRVSVGG